MNKHTPGPWRAVDDLVYLGDDYLWIETTNGNGDAALIAAAPCLMEALEALADRPRRDSDDEERAIANARAAIAKAKGENK